MTGAGTCAQRRQAVRAAAQALYTGQLTADPGAQAYLTSRGIDAALARRLGLGAAGRSWTGAVHQLRHAGYTDTEMVDAGVGFRSGKHAVVDVFRSRVLFPAHDRHGQLVGWAGRSTPTAPPQAPAWLNSAAGDYRKAELLHGLHEGRTRLAAGATPVLCEGVLDAHAVTLATHHTCIGLAPGGTALTAQHVAALHQALPAETDAPQRGRSRPRVLVAFDADDAGRHAAVAAWPMLHAAGLDTALVTLPTGTDPAEVPAQVLRHAIHTAQPLADLVIDHTLNAWPERRRWAEHTVAASRAAARTIATLRPEQIGRQVTRVATALHIPTEAVTTAVTDAATQPSPPNGALAKDNDDWHQPPATRHPGRAC